MQEEPGERTVISHFSAALVIYKLDLSISVQIVLKFIQHDSGPSHFFRMANRLPDTMKALIIEGRGKATIIDSPPPKLRDGLILVKTTAVAVNPSDWKHIDFMWVGDPTGTRPGLDYAGVILEIGPGVEKDLKVGDRVCGICNGSCVKSQFCLKR